MRNLKDILIEGFYKNIGTPECFAKWVCENTYNIASKYSNDSCIHIPTPSGRPSNKTYNLRVVGPYSIEVCDINGFSQFADKGKKSFVLDFEPYLDLIKEKAILFNNTPLNDFSLTMWSYDRDRLYVGIRNSKTQTVSFRYSKKDGLYV